MSVNDYVKTNEEQKEIYLNKFMEKVYVPYSKDMAEWMYRVAEFTWDKIEQASMVDSFTKYMLLFLENKEFIIDYDTYERLTKEMVEYGPGQIHGYVKEDGNFHIWMEKLDDGSEDKRSEIEERLSNKEAGEQ